jgi:hypothetical protein
MEEERGGRRGCTGKEKMGGEADDGELQLN